MTYRWDFGDGTPISLSANPVHVFNAPAGQPTTFVVRLTVQDCCGGTDDTELLVSVNNSPPQVNITSPADGTRYPLDQGDLHYPLEAVVSDVEDSNDDLFYEWTATLHHNDHVHIEPTITAPSGSTIITPAGGDGERYFYRITLKVTDTHGLSTEAETFLYPDEAGTPILTADDGFSVAYGGAKSLDVLGNDRGAMNEVDFASVQIVEEPQHGVAVLDPQTGKISYSHNGTLASSDEFMYRVATTAGIVSDPARVRINFEGGLVGEYYSDASFSQLVNTKTDPEVNFDWALESPAVQLPQDQFSVRWTGSVIPETGGAHTFYVTADDGVRLWVNEELVIDAWADSINQEVSGTINLVGGKAASLRLEYHELAGIAKVQLMWSGEFQSKEIISRHDLMPVAPGDARPAVQIASPSAGTMLKQGSPVDLEAIVAPVAGDAVNLVEFLVDGAVVGSANAAPWRVAWTPGTEGTVSLSARATSAAGVVGDSSAFPLSLVVGAPNQAPTASSDTADVYPAGETFIDVLANDVDLDGQLDPASVEITSLPAQGTLTVDPSSGEIRYLHGPTTASGGVDAFSYRVADDNGALSNVATVTLNVVRTWAGWQSQHAGAGALPTSNGDGDRYVDLLEFALGGDPFDGATGDTGLRLEEVPGGTIDAFLVRPAGIAGISTALEYCSDLVSGSWATLPTPVVTLLPDGREELRFQNVSGQPGMSRSRGFVRLKVGLPDGNGTTVGSAALGWYDTTFVEGYQTYGISLPQPAVFAGVVASADFPNWKLNVTGAGFENVLAAGEACYVEFTSGPIEGHRFDIDSGASSGETVQLLAGSPNNTLGSLHPGAVASPFLIRRHDRLGDIFEKDRFHGSNRSSESDQLMFFTEAGFVTYFLLKAGGNYDHWVAAADSGLASQQDRVVPPGKGIFVIRKNPAPLGLLRIGEVRDYDFAQPLRPGYNLLAEPVPLDRSPLARDFALENGFTGSTTSATSDLISRWKGDGTPGSEGYENFFLLNHVPPYRHWTSAADSNLPNLNDAPLFRHNRAVFLRLQGSGRPYYRVAKGWQ